METKSILVSKRSWLNYGTIIGLALASLFTDEAFKALVMNMLGAKGVIFLMVGGALINQFLTQTSTKKPEFRLPEKKKPKSNLDILNNESQADDDYTKNF